MVSFQCDLCHFKNLNGIDLQRKSENSVLLKTIRRVSLDIFWSHDLGIAEIARGIA